MHLCVLAGPVKSGTTLLVSLLDGHPEIASFPLEVKFFTHWYERLKLKNITYSELNDFFLKKSKLALMDPKRPGSADIMNSGRIDFSGFDFDQFAVAMEQRSKDVQNSIHHSDDLFRRYLIDIHVEVARQLGKSTPKVIISKEGNHGAKHRRVIGEFFPRVKFLVVVRDPRDVYASFKLIAEKKRKGVKSPTFKDTVTPMSFLYLNKKKNFSAFQEINREGKEGRYHLVRYEDLVKEVKTEMTKVAHFLGVAFSDCVTKPTNFGNPWGGNASSMEAFSGLASNRAGKWRNELTRSETRIIEFFLSDYLVAGGYSHVPRGISKLKIISDIIRTEYHGVLFPRSLSTFSLRIVVKSAFIVLIGIYSALFSREMLGR